MLDNKTCDLPTVRADQRLFTWGRVEQIHDISAGTKTGSYTIIEYVDWRSKTTLFHPYVDGKNCHTSCASMEEALIHAIAYRRLGANQSMHLTTGIMRMLTAPERF
jgi:hypothetical protein